jgi:hypothetical protein
VYPGGDSGPEDRRQRVNVRVASSLTQFVEAFLTTFPYQTCDAQRAIGECDPLVSAIRLRTPPALAEHLVTDATVPD